MGVYIKGMEMPERCSECPLEAYDEDYYGYESNYNCPLIYKGYTEKNRDAYRRNDCPLIEVPPHGRLIDADAYIAYIRNALSKAITGENVTPNGAILAMATANSFIDDMVNIEITPTIIEAEGEENG